jgi:DNA-binding CsgD family transcriptional regulator
MLSLILIVTFVFCLGMAVAAVLIGHQLITTYASEFPRYYFYYLAAFYAFAFYGLWGQILSRAVLASFDTQDATIEIFANFIPILSVPLLFVSWLMLVSMAHSLVGKAMRPAWYSAHALIFIALLAGSWIAIALLEPGPEAPTTSLGLIEACAIIAIELVYYSAFVILIVRSKDELAADRRVPILRFALLVFGAYVFRSLLAGLALLDLRLGALSLLAFFGANLVPLLYLRGTADRVFDAVRAEHASNQGLTQIFERHGVTRREQQIVQKICLGKTNKQIAEELFITLQTVKDHTHRIYSKVGVKSRIQLVQLMNAAK